MRWQPLRLVDSLGSNLTDGWPGAEQQTRVPVKNGCGRKQCRRETSGVCQATILRTAIATCLFSTAAPLTARPTQGECNVPLVFHIDKGDYNGVALDGLNVAVIAHTPGPMANGNWTLAAYVDERADEKHEVARLQFLQCCFLRVA